MKYEMEVGNRGTVVVELYEDKAPKTVKQIGNFIEDGFYDAQHIHRVENWVVQWGDPLSKDLESNGRMVGSGGSGKSLPFESNDVPMKRGVLAMASTGAGVGGDSQMFVLKNDGDWLQGSYCAFGAVVEGMEVIDSIQKNDAIISIKKLAD